MNSTSTVSAFTPGIKPSASVERLISVCLPFGTKIDTSIGDVHLIRKNAEEGQLIVMVLEGVLRVYRNSDNLLYGLIPAPAFIGALGSDFRQETYDFMAVKNSSVMTIPQEQAIDLITEHSLVKDLLCYYTYINDYLAYHSALMISRTAYEIVCGLLYELTLFPESARRKISIANYITDRSNLSRSGVLRIISNLKEGGYVEINNGKLVAILKNFPAGY